MLRVISIRPRTTASFKLTKLFGIDDFSVAMDSGKVLIITIYCFYNYYKTKIKGVLECKWVSTYKVLSTVKNNKRSIQTGNILSRVLPIVDYNGRLEGREKTIWVIKGPFKLSRTISPNSWFVFSFHRYVKGYHFPSNLYERGTVSVKNGTKRVSVWTSGRSLPA